ncbi:hypothetical protein M426DRAFT_14235 [Hypoxylon sp. CI-4A]|nr:hypothetical protein M426DRAFT_14235 [Hypoxylon sp. CI-4A]
MAPSDRIQEVSDKNAGLIAFIHKVKLAAGSEKDKDKQRAAQAKINSTQSAVDECAQIASRAGRIFNEYMGGKENWSSVEALISEWETCYNEVDTAYCTCANILGV